MKKIAVFFPGIGYTADKPLLHYSRRLAADLGYEIRLLPYTGFPEKVRGDRNKMVESYEIALEQSRQMLADVDFTDYEDILFIGKSIGTIVSARLASECPAPIRQVFYTPLEDTFLFPFEDAITFTGTADPWVGMERSRIRALCEERNIRCVVLPDANHSLESRDLQQDIKNLSMVMEETSEFILHRTIPAGGGPLSPDA